jgi:hypothetical protein
MNKSSACQKSALGVNQFKMDFALLPLLQFPNTSAGRPAMTSASALSCAFSAVNCEAPLRMTPNDALCVFQ